MGRAAAKAVSFNVTASITQRTEKGKRAAQFIEN